MLLLALALWSGQATTVCERIGAQTVCRQQEGGSSDVDAAMQRLLDSGRRNAEMAENQRAQQVSQDAEKEAELGKRIAAGDCDGAKRLAEFYGNKALIARVANACR